MADVLNTYAVGDALSDAIAELTPALLGRGHVRIGVHNLTRDNFDQIAGEGQHFKARKTNGEFWTKSGFHWDNERHLVDVQYFTTEPPVVVPLKAEKDTVAQ